MIIHNPILNKIGFFWTVLGGEMADKGVTWLSIRRNGHGPEWVIQYGNSCAGPKVVIDQVYCTNGMVVLDGTLLFDDGREDTSVKGYVIPKDAIVQEVPWVLTHLLFQELGEVVREGRILGGLLHPVLA